MLSPAKLSEVLVRPSVATEDLTPFLDEYLRQDPAVPTVPVPESVPGLVGATGLFGGWMPSVGSFDDPLWHLHCHMWGVAYDKVGRFEGEPAVVANGGRDYKYRPGVPAFRFIRANGEEVIPGSMITDGGSIPRIAWAIPGLDPWVYMPAFLIHDWDFMAHHCTPGYSRSFEDANLTLAEGVYTLMKSGVVPEDWRVLVAIHTGVSSFIGRKVWGRAWTADQCQVALNP